MTYLQLVARLRSKAGITGSGPLTVLNQSEEMARLVDWIAEAYEDIQNKHEDWYFMRYDFTFNTSIAQSTYARSIITAPALENWKVDSLRIYTTATGVDDQQWLLYRDWDYFRDTRLFSSVAAQTGRPIDFTVKPDKTLQLWPIPNNVYTVTGEYYRTAHVMTLDADTPLFTQYQSAIMYNALMAYAAYVENPSLYAYAQKEYGRLIMKMELDRGPNIVLGGALA